MPVDGCWLPEQAVVKTIVTGSSHRFGDQRFEGFLVLLLELINGLGKKKTMELCPN